MPGVLCIAGDEAMLKHRVDAFWHIAPGATALLALLAPLEPTTHGHSTTSQLVCTNEGLSREKHGTTVDPAMLSGMKLQLTDPASKTPRKIDLILVANVYETAILERLIKGHLDHPLHKIQFMSGRLPLL